MACRYIPNPSSCRPTYLVIFKGDDTNFPGNQRIDLVIDTELDLTGIKAHFRFMDFVQDFNEIPADKRLQIVIPHEKTSAFPLGSADASLTFEDAGGKIRTVSNRIHVVVTNSVREAYNNQDTQSITVTVTGTVTWDMIHGKPNASDSNPLMDGEPSAGESFDYSREDHRHPSDTSKRGLEDFDVRGAPQGEGSWFVVSPNYVLTYRPDEDEWREQTASLYMIRKSGGQYELIDDIGELIGTFTLTESEGYSAIVGEQQIHVIGYIDKLVKESQIPTVPTAFNTTPLMDSQAGSAGSSSQFARGDHSHPSDTSKMDGTATYPAWLRTPPNPYVVGQKVSNKGLIWKCTEAGTTNEPGVSEFGWEEVTVESLLYEKQDALTPAQTNAVNSGVTAAKVAAWDGYAAQIAQKASLTDLPYRLVEPGEWEFSGSGVQDGHVYSVVESYVEPSYAYDLYDNGTIISSYGTSERYDVGDAIDFSESGGPPVAIVATRTGIHLHDRAGNRVVVSGDTTLTLPAANPGYARDLLVRLTVSATSAVTWTVAQGETWDAMGAPPASFAAGTYLYRITEVAPGVFHAEDMMALVGLETALAAINGGVAS